VSPNSVSVLIEKPNSVGGGAVQDAGWKLNFQALHFGQHGIAHVQGVGSRQLENADTYASATVETKELAVALGA